MNKNFVADDNVTLFESLAIGNATVDEFTINTDAKKVINTVKANKKLTESTATLSNKEKSFSGQMINVWDKLDNVSSVPEIISFVKDNFKDTPYKEKVLHNLKSKKNVMSAIGYLSSIVTKGDGITLNKGKQESLKEAGKADAVIAVEEPAELPESEDAFIETPVQIVTSLEEKCASVKARRHARVLKECMRKFFIDPEEDTEMYVDKDGTTHSLMELKCKWNGDPASIELQNYETKEDWLADTLENMDYVGKDNTRLTEDINKLLPKVGKFELITLTENNLNNYDIGTDDFQAWWSMDGKVVKEVYSYERSDTDEQLPVVGVAYTDGTLAIIGLHTDKFVDSYDEMQSYLNKYAKLNESISLDEAIPRDLANAYKKYNINNINDHANAMTDFQNAEYDEITPEEAIALKKAGQADQVIAKIGDNPVRFYNDGSAKVYREQDADLNVRKNFGTLIKNADKIYKTNEDDKDLKQSLADKRNQKSAQRTLPSNKRDYYYNDDREIERGTGAHREKESETLDQSYLNRYKDALAKLNQQYEDGDISRKEYEATKASYEDKIKGLETRVKEHEKRVKERENERKQELMRGAETRNMRAPINRYHEIKRSGTEQSLASSEAKLAQATQAVDLKIKRLEAELEKLKNDKMADNDIRWETSRKADLEQKLEKEKQDMNAIKSGKYVPESLQEELENIELETEDDITNIELHDNGKLEISSEPKNIDIEEDSDNVIEEITEDELSELENDTEDFVDESSDNFNIEESFDTEISPNGLEVPSPYDKYLVIRRDNDEVSGYDKGDKIGNETFLADLDLKWPWIQAELEGESLGANFALIDNPTSPIIMWRNENEIRSISFEELKKIAKEQLKGVINRYSSFLNESIDEKESGFNKSLNEGYAMTYDELVDSMNGNMSEEQIDKELLDHARIAAALGLGRKVDDLCIIPLDDNTLEYAPSYVSDGGAVEIIKQLKMVRENVEATLCTVNGIKVVEENIRNDIYLWFASEAEADNYEKAVVSIVDESSDITNKAITNAGLEIVKDEHGDYEVIAK